MLLKNLIRKQNLLFTLSLLILQGKLRDRINLIVSPMKHLLLVRLPVITLDAVHQINECRWVGAIYGTFFSII